MYDIKKNVIDKITLSHHDLHSFWSQRNIINISHNLYYIIILYHYIVYLFGIFKCEPELTTYLSNIEINFMIHYDILN